MPVGAESSTVSEPIRLRRSRYQAISDTDSNPHIPPIVQSSRPKSSISSLLLSTFTNTQNRTTAVNSYDRKKKSKNSSLRGFGCTADPEVAVPATVIRSSADWDDKREKRNKSSKKERRKKKGYQHNMVDGGGPIASIGMQDVCCGPGIGGFAFATDAAAPAAVVVPTRPLSGRGKIDIDKIHQRERSSYFSRQRVNAEHFAPYDLDSAFEIPRFGSDVFEARYFHHLRSHTPDGLAEIMVYQNGLFMGGRSDGFDRYRDWRLDVDHMSYEELLELGDRIGYVCTGLGEVEIGRCIRKTNFSFLDDLSSHLQGEVNGKCSICQEEFEAGDEMGKLDCGHAYHIQCIKQWLVQKNACPVCKATASQ
ncbi:hypothetical protein Nepgr_024073 [Nepenthes gracilis]|uniref:RING-type E3 ubiquitin transferase n=1 Tax=Nepenthes gracilis TaxID=150966 RepID=A0AAD3XZP7_NEPGR|nr:hypothetical protein Nepgr_024073 [Nepenthes gracilis]